MTTPDPRTDLAGYLGLTDEQARICRQSAEGGYTGIRGKVGARLIEQEQARDAVLGGGRHRCGGYLSPPGATWCRACGWRSDAEPDDGLIPVTVRLTAEEVRDRVAAASAFCTYGGYITASAKIDEACRVIDLPPPEPPRKSPLADLPDLTESLCAEAYYFAQDHPDVNTYKAQIGRALIAAGYTPEEEA